MRIWAWHDEICCAPIGSHCTPSASVQCLHEGAQSLLEPCRLSPCHRALLSSHRQISSLRGTAGHHRCRGPLTTGRRHALTPGAMRRSWSHHNTASDAHSVAWPCAILLSLKKVGRNLFRFPPFSSSTGFYFRVIEQEPFILNKRLISHRTGEARPMNHWATPAGDQR
jgi:hypothetical protein